MTTLDLEFAFAVFGGFAVILAIAVGIGQRCQRALDRDVMRDD